MKINTFPLSLPHAELCGKFMICLSNICFLQHPMFCFWLCFWWDWKMPSPKYLYAFSNNVFQLAANRSSSCCLFLLTLASLVWNTFEIETKLAGLPHSGYHSMTLCRRSLLWVNKKSFTLICAKQKRKIYIYFRRSVAAIVESINLPKRRTRLLPLTYQQGTNRLSRVWHHSHLLN